MNLDTVKLIYFSPTDTTRKIVSEIAQGTKANTVNHINITMADSNYRGNLESQADLAIIGMPVYGGRLPVDAVERMKGIHGNGTPAIIVILYGNRAYEDALIELRDVAIEAGFVPVAAGAFIGEHSFSTDDALIAHHRPDVVDLECASNFGNTVRTLIESLQNPIEIPPLDVPGNVPYQDYRVPKDIAPTSDNLICTRCGACATVCPTGAISLQDNEMQTDASLCILCCACVKSCTTGGRELDNALINKVRGMLTTKFSERKEPVLFFPASYNPD